MTPTPHRPRAHPRRWLRSLAVSLLLVGCAPGTLAQLPGLGLPGTEAAAEPPPAPEDRLADETAAAEAAGAAAREQQAREAAFAEASEERIREEEALLRAARERPVLPEAPALAAMPPAEVRRLLAEKETAVAANRSQELSVQAELDRISRRLEALPAETEAARNAVEQARLLLAEAAEGPERDLRDAQLRAATSRLELLAEEATSLPLRERLVRTRHERLLAEGVKLQEELERLNRRDAALRQREAEAQSRAAREAVAAATDLPPAARALASRLVELAERREEIEQEAAAFNGRAADVLRERDLYRQQLESARSRVEVGMTEAVGVQLLERRRDLPDAGVLRRGIRELEAKLAGYSTTLLDLADDRRSLPTDLARARAQLGPNAEAEQLARLEEIERVYREMVDAASEAAKQAYDDALNLSAAQKGRQAALEAYAGFLNERLLWTPDLGPIQPSDLPRAWSAAKLWWGRFDAGAALAEAGAALASPGFGEVLLFALGLVLLGSRSRLRGKIAELSEPVGTLARDRFRYTLEAFGATVLVALPFPLMLLAIGRALPPSSEVVVVGQVGGGLVAAAVVLMPVLLVRVLCRRDGLAPVHFLWPEAGCRALRSAILRLGLLLVAFRFCSRFLTPGGVAGLGDSNVGAGMVLTPDGAEGVDLRLIGRLFLILTLVGVSVFMARMFRRNGALGAEMWHEPGRPLARFHRVWYPVLVGVPLAVAALAGFGYFYTALALESRLLWTVWVFTAVVIGYAMALRWLRLTHRQLMYAELLKKREAQKAAAAAAEEDLRKKKEAARAARRAGAIEGDDDETDEGEDDAREQLAAIAEQAVEGDTQLTPFSLNEKTGKLIKLCGGLALLAGLWFVWHGILPALEFLNTVKLPLLTQTVSLNGVEAEVPVTLGQLFLCIGLLVLTFTAGRQLPGLLDLLVLTRFKVQAGTRYAATMLTQYVIVAAGLLLALSAIGLGWGRLQWLVAALSVGLGFGLQEIFANFVSGLIILFERPIRVGDTVSIGETTGVVTRIRIRATTITDLDLRELIVPNREFITGQLINWSLSNPVIRLTIPVGIAYGADTRLAQKLLIQVARKHRDVLNEPASSALFMGFGDNTLNFELRIFVKEVLRRFQILSELNLAIDDAFADAGITIAFPQRDVHLDTLKPLEVVVSRRGAK